MNSGLKDENGYLEKRSIPEQKRADNKTSHIDSELVEINAKEGEKPRMILVDAKHYKGPIEKRDMEKIKGDADVRKEKYDVTPVIICT